MAVSLDSIKVLRERSGAGILDCNKALKATDGDVEAALDMMRKAGQASAVKKEGRIAAEGLVLVKVDPDQQCAAMVEVNCETDFVSRCDDFRSFVCAVLDQIVASQSDNKETVLGMPSSTSSYALSHEEVCSASQGEKVVSPNLTIEEARRALIAKVGENIQVRRLAFMEKKGVLGTYLHGGRIGVCVNLTRGTPALAKDLAMHIAANKPQVIQGQDLGEDILAREKAIYRAQAEASGKPADIIEKMVTGRLNKFMAEVSLLGQPFVKDPEHLVADILKKSNAEVDSFIRFELGEGIEKKAVNFAQEVMAQLKGSL